MSKGTAIDLGLNEAYNDLFSTQAERDNAGRSYLTDIPAAEISDFPNHPFHVRMDEEMEWLVDSVKERGVLSPVLVRPMPDGGYQMVSGHRRKRAAELAELSILSNPWNACEQTHGIPENRVTLGKQEDLTFNLVRSTPQREQHVCVKRNQHRKRIPMDGDLFCGTGNGI